MAEALLELDAISRNYTASQNQSTNSFRSLHSSVSDISSRSRKIREATRSHLRALKNVMKTEKELAAAIASYTIPEWLSRVGEACTRRPKADAACTTSDLCKAMSRLVISKAYLDSKPYNPVAESLGQTVDRYVANIVAAAEDRVLVKFMNAASLASTAGSAQKDGTGQLGVTFSASGSKSGRTLSLMNNNNGNNNGAMSTQGGAGAGGHARVMSTATAFDETLGMSRTASAGVNAASSALNKQVAVLFGDSPPPDMLEASELLSALFKNYCRIKAVLEVKSHVLDKIYQVLEERISEYRRLRIEGIGAGGGGAAASGAKKSFFSFGADDDGGISGSSSKNAGERLSRCLKELMVNALQDSIVNRRNNSSSDGNGRNPLLNVLSAQSSAAFGGSSTLLMNNTNMTQQQQSAATTLGITDYPECIFGVSKAARDLALDVSSFLDKFVLSYIPPPPKRKTATEKMLDGTSNKNRLDVYSPFRDNNNNADPSSPTNTNGDTDLPSPSSVPVNANDTAAPLDPDAADEIDALRASILVIPAEIIEVASTFALELLAKMVADLATKEVHSLDSAPIILLEAVQEAWAWRHVAREISGKTDALRESVDQKVDAILQSAFDSLANMRDEPGNLTSQAYLDLALAPRNTAFNNLAFEILYITGVQALADSQPLNRDKKLIMNWRVDDTFKRASWHPERDPTFGFSSMLIDSLRTMINVHEATLHVVFSGSVERLDNLIKKADKAIALKTANLAKEAKYKHQRNASRQNKSIADGNNNMNDGDDDDSPMNSNYEGTVDFANLNFSSMIEAESAAKGVFEAVRADVESFFENTVANHLIWMSSVASAAFLLAHGDFETDESSGALTSQCNNIGDEAEDDLLWFKIPAGKVRFHPAVFRANTIQKIIRRLSAPGVFDAAATNQLVWSHGTMMHLAAQHQQQQFRSSNPFAVTTKRSNPGAVFSVDAPLALKKPDLSLFGGSPSGGGGGSAFGGVAAFDTAGLFSPNERQQPGGSNPLDHEFNNNNNKPSAVATAETFHHTIPSSNNNNNNNDHDKNKNAAKLAAELQQRQQPWRAKLLENLLVVCNDKLQQQVDVAGARWATILPTITENEILVEISESDEHSPLTHDQRAEVKRWYEKATAAIEDELELFETGVLVIEDPGLRTMMGEAAYENTQKIFDEMEHEILKGREWSTRATRWLKFPLENLERALKTFRAPLLRNE